MQTLRRYFSLSLLAALSAIVLPASADQGITDQKIILGQSAAFTGPADN